MHLITLLLIATMSFSGLQARSRDSYHARAAAEVARQEELERQARIEIRAEQLRRDDAENAILYALGYGCFVITAGCAKGVWFIVKNGVKSGWYVTRCTAKVLSSLATEPDGLLDRLKHAHVNDYVGMAGSAAVFALIGTSIANLCTQR